MLLLLNYVIDQCMLLLLNSVINQCMLLLLNSVINQCMLLLLNYVIDQCMLVSLNTSPINACYLQVIVILIVKMLISLAGFLKSTGINKLYASTEVFKLEIQFRGIWVEHNFRGVFKSDKWYEHLNILCSLFIVFIVYNCYCYFDLYIFKVS
jgi:flagellar biosynthesis protein FlhB